MDMQGSGTEEGVSSFPISKQTLKLRETNPVINKVTPVNFVSCARGTVTFKEGRIMFPQLDIDLPACLKTLIMGQTAGGEANQLKNLELNLGNLAL